MVDIVERLRVSAVETFDRQIADIMESAADEIEKLRAIQYSIASRLSDLDPAFDIDDHTPTN